MAQTLPTQQLPVSAFWTEPAPQPAAEPDATTPRPALRLKRPDAKVVQRLPETVTPEPVRPELVTTKVVAPEKLAPAPEKVTPQVAPLRLEKVGPPERTWLLLQMGRWLKERFVHKLLVDRKALLESQQAATLKVLEVDARLSRLESQMKEQHRAYQQRIEELNRQLLAAKDENRELIRAQIRKVKAEMEAAQDRAEAWRS
jgi:hypothetical protein